MPWLCSSQVAMATSTTTPAMVASSLPMCTGAKSGFEPYCFTHFWQKAKLIIVITIPTTLRANATLQPKRAASHGVASIEKNEPMLMDM